MKLGKIMLTLFTISVIAIGTIGFSQIQAVPQQSPERHIIVLNDDADPWSVANEMAQERGLSIAHVYGTAVNGFSGIIPPGQLDKIASDPRVKYIEKDYVMYISARGGVPGPPSGGGDDDEEPVPSSQEIPTGIKRIYGDKSSTKSGDKTGSVDVDVAVIDTGIDPNHFDLNVIDGVNFASGKKWNDGNGHGTHVAGTIAARDNDIGVVGVAPDARLYAVRVLNNAGSGFMSDVIAGVDWVASQREQDPNYPNDPTKSIPVIEVANMSLGGSKSSTLNTAVDNAVKAGVVFVVAAGNSDTDACTKSPASAPSAITVSALDDRNGESNNGSDPIASFSNYGECVDMIAPGVLILSTWKGGGYNTISGTSMASPHVAGAAALYLANNAGKTPNDVFSALENNGAIDWDNSDDGDYTKEPLLDVSGF